MIDCENPVFSPHRASLVAFVPDSARLGEPAAFTAAFVERVRASAGAAIPGRAEHDLLANLAVPEDRWRQEFAGRLSRVLAAVAPRLQTLDGFAPLYELAESRRREFRRRPLAEFRLTTPTTNIPETAPLLEMTADGTVRPRSDAHMALPRFDAPASSTISVRPRSPNGAIGSPSSSTRRAIATATARRRTPVRACSSSTR
jgi:hypothetical protein